MDLEQLLDQLSMLKRQKLLWILSKADLTLEEQETITVVDETHNSYYGKLGSIRATEHADRLRQGSGDVRHSPTFQRILKPYYVRKLFEEHRYSFDM